MEKLEIYIHIPFCLSKCGYCDFLSFAASETEKTDYIKALIEEIRGFPAKDQYEVSTVFIGGGTPSVLSTDRLEKILYELKDSFKISESAEVSIECNPKTADHRKFTALKKTGVNRLSIGVQSFDDEMLKKLGRVHTKQDAVDTVGLAKAAGFENINADLMFSLPGQSLENWRESLQYAADLELTHISAYSLMIEEGTPFFEQYNASYEKKISAKAQTLLPSEEEEVQMYEYAVSFLKKHGYERYEISNFAKAGFACKHNDGYWTRVPYVGFGLGAASLVNETRFENTRDMRKYMGSAGDIWKVNLNGGRKPLSREEAMSETLFLGLRRCAGVSVSGFKEKFGVDIFEKYGKIIEKHVRNGYLKVENDAVFLTPSGILISNICLADFV